MPVLIAALGCLSDENERRNGEGQSPRSVLGEGPGPGLTLPSASMSAPGGLGKGLAASAVLPSLELLRQAASQNSSRRVSHSAPSWLSRDPSLDPICVLESLTLPTQDLDALIH